MSPPPPHWAVDWFDLVQATTAAVSGCQGHARPRSQRFPAFLHLLALTSFPAPFLLLFPEPLRGLDVPLGLSAHGRLFTAFDQLLVSALTAAHCKTKLL